MLWFAEVTKYHVHILCNALVTQTKQSSLEKIFMYILICTYEFVILHSKHVRHT